ncbi:MAG TPA: hypothetical protein VEK57_19390 [Thermoanaerobaculia bacterium]|nr:hypothetical protein [Thermoanaerobaculia bacterium]
MLNRIFPERIDNHYRGHKLALWFFVPVTLMKIGISMVHIFYADGGGQSISKMPLDAYPAGATQNVVALYARMGVDQLILGLLFVLVLFRYRAMIPLMYLVAVTHYIALKAIASAKPIAAAGRSSAGTMALILTFLTVTGFVLSLLRKDDPPAQG